MGVCLLNKTVALSAYPLFSFAVCVCGLGYQMLVYWMHYVFKPSADLVLEFPCHLPELQRHFQIPSNNNPI